MRPASSRPCRWLPALLLAALAPRTRATDAPAAPAPEVDLEQVTVYGREADLIGQASSAAEGYVGAAELDARPLLRRGELLESIPGVIITQHSGDGKANQYFLRGFNLDHGTDFASSVDGMPVNLPSNAHGQGYSDLNFIIPEFVENISYEKGVYYAANGDFSAAGAAQFHLFDALPANFVKLEAGEYEYSRLVLGETIKDPAGAATTLGFEAGYNNGPWTHPEDAEHLSGLIRQSWTAGDDAFALTAMAYHATWNSTDQVPERAIEEGVIPRFGAIDPTDGGMTARDSLAFDWIRREPDATDHLNLYAFYYRLSLYSDFTYFLTDPLHGDQFNQQDRRGVFGGSDTRNWTAQLAGRKLDLTVGAQGRADVVNLGLLDTEARQEIAPVALDSVHEYAGALFAQGTWSAADWLRIVAGGRADAYGFVVDDDRPANSGRRAAEILSPKLAVVLGPWNRTELYLDAGDGFHSNDARGTVEHVDPQDGSAASPVTPLARAEGLEAGLRTSFVPGLVSTVSLWLLDLDSELTFDGDSGETDVNGPTRRYGMEWANFYRPASWLSLDADLAFTHARYRQETNGGFDIANSIATVATGGATVGATEGWFGALRARYFGPQPEVETGQATEPSSLTWNGRLGWRCPRWALAADLLNIFDRANDDIAYYYVSRLPGEPAAGVAGTVLHPAEARE
ncbi:MAG TPA: TonB-dependent receptor, partial [Opitutaceae bacterium]|nr:TonB-dependent receptor [Opitutaceae bacterium]